MKKNVRKVSEYISAEGRKNAGVNLLIIKETGEIWTKMKYTQNGLGVRNIIYKAKSPIKEQIKRYKMTKREIFEKFDNLSEDELNAKKNKKQRSLC